MQLRNEAVGDYVGKAALIAAVPRLAQYGLLGLRRVPVQSSAKQPNESASRN